MKTVWDTLEAIKELEVLDEQLRKARQQVKDNMILSDKWVEGVVRERVILGYIAARRKK